MITRKSKIKYEVIFTPLEYDKFIDLTNDSTSAICEMIYFNPRKINYKIYFTKKQYELFKRLYYYETKNKK